jgi:hypothetical protein
MGEHCSKKIKGQYLVSNLPAGIVNRLINHIESLNRNFYNENWYNIYPLAKHVLKNKTVCLGTASKNK